MSDLTPLYLADYQAPEFTINTVNLTFTLADNETIVSNEMLIDNLSGTNTLKLHGEQLTLLSVCIDDIALDASRYQTSDTGLMVVVPTGQFTLSIKTKISPIDNSALEGLYKSGDAYCTQCEAEGFRRITYYLDRPDVLSVFTTKIIANKKDFPYLLSNGNNIASGDLADGQHFVTWHDPHPKPCYLFALVAGDFDLLKDQYTTITGNDVSLEIFVDKGNLSKASHAMESLKHSMKWDEDTFGLVYDLDTYMIVAVDFFNMGAMENKGLNVFNSKYVLADEQTATDSDYFNIEAVIGHEYFHNWTGNRVTCRDWFQLSLKEGLTVFRDQQFSADLNSSAVTRIQNVRVLRSHQFAEDASPMAHPIRPEKVVEMNNFYTLTVYEKGAEVIRMLHTLLGKEKFRQGMDLYFSRFDGMAVTCDDFVNAMADASNIDLSQFKHWYSQAGTPQLTVSESFDQASGTYSLTVKQTHPATAGQKNKVNLHIPIKIELLPVGDNATSTHHLLELKTTEQCWQFNGYSIKPTVAFLADLSAPVKVSFNQNDAELEQIMVAAEDQFCRWDAGQKLFTRYINLLMVEPNSELPSSLLHSFVTILTSTLDPALIAEQLTLPSFDEIADNVGCVDPDAILAALARLKSFLATGLNSELLTTYENAQQLLESNQLSNKAAVAKRALKNICLSYLALLPEHTDLVKIQYQQATNMTDTLAAMTASAKNNLPVFADLSKHFEEKWYDTTLVMDKWFSLVAQQNSPVIIERLASLQAHPLFSLNNPNRARSLISAFTMMNPKYFHCVSGKGYQFLVDNIVKLNEINPQVASRLITPLLAFKRYEPNRQNMLKKHLEMLSGLANLSRDLKEKIDAALGNAD